MILFAKQKYRQRHEEIYRHQGGRGGGGMNWEIGMDICSLLTLHIKQIPNENLLDSSGNSTQCSVVTQMGRKSKKGDIYLRKADSLCCTGKKLTRYWKATMPQQKLTLKHKNVINL